jgi:hypothetical protein
MAEAWLVLEEELLCVLLGHLVEAESLLEADRVPLAVVSELVWLDPL